MQIVADDLSDESVRELLRIHLSGMQASSPPDNVFALDLSGLLQPEITVWTCRVKGTAVGCGALKALGDKAGEIKSMRTHPHYLRRGVARRILEHIISVARSRGYEKLSLETGTGPAFEPALKLYQTYGFKFGLPFSTYKLTEFSQFLHLSLD